MGHKILKLNNLNITPKFIKENLQKNYMVITTTFYAPFL